MFVLFFACFIFMFTVFENIYVAIGLLAIILLILYFIHQRKKNKNFKKICIYCSLAFVLSLWSYVFHSFSAQSKPVSTLVRWTGQIADTYTQWKYIFSNTDGSWILQSSKEYAIGDEIFLAGTIAPTSKNSNTESAWFLAFDFNKWLKMKWLQGTIYETNSFPVQKEILSWVKALKKNLQEKIISSYGKNKISWLVLWMLIGDRSQIPPSDYQSFINSGLVHIIAVSGWNIVMITVFLGFILFFLPFYLRTILILIVIILYGLLCGLDSSVFRAILTGGLSLIALFRWKEIPIRRLMSVAFIAMVMINPYYLVYDVGFLMSFAAVIGIVIISWKQKAKSEKLEEESTKQNSYIWKGLSYIRNNYLQPSLWATMGVFPIIIFFMWKINIVSIIGNLFVLPIIPFVMIYGFISIFVYQWLPWQWILRIEKILITYMYRISHLSAQRGVYLLASWWIKWVILIGGIFLLAKRRIFSPVMVNKGHKTDIT